MLLDPRQKNNKSRETFEVIDKITTEVVKVEDDTLNT